MKVEEVRQGIVEGTLTRERVCDGKIPFMSYDHAERRKKAFEAKHKKRYRVYPCPFCQRWHLATERS